MKTYIIYLAAGNSRRFGSNKLLYQLNGKELYRYGLDELVKLVSYRDDCKLIVVTQHLEIIPKYSDLNYVYSSTCQKGISHSIKAGLEMIDLDTESIMFVVADQPNLNYLTLNQMLNAFNQSNYSLASLAYKDKCGNPTIFASKYFNELKHLQEDQGGRVIINKYQDDCLFYQVSDERELFDIDNMKDLEDF